MNAELNHFEVFPWSKALETGIDSIDEQHKKLLSLINRLANQLAFGDEIALAQIFEEVAAYASYHFEDEESVWMTYFESDDWYLKHEKAHKSFLPKVVEIKESNHSKPVTQVLEMILRYLIRWVSKHIIDNDIRLAIAVLKIEEGFTQHEAKIYADNKLKDNQDVLTDTVLNMYDKLASQVIELVRERQERKKVEQKLIEANSMLEKLSQIDDLTGLNNRRSFNNIFKIELRRARRSRKYLGLIMLDLDYFKCINDRYGHANGDKALIAVAQILIQFSRRAGDYSFRLGGEEFAVLVTAENDPVPEIYCENIHREIHSLMIRNEGSKVSKYLTVSIGMATKIPNQNDSIESFMKMADNNLYRAKHQGRNKAVCS